ncbi:transforming growth factor-beta-induced protein ig-h3 isoform X2 [Toxorhynchites rutilus septentrionalis]|uniref:transforming growth factor-beta-induced protein ig-h3 isoform X2 n=1 Tax=Toxorhynchites rutilus septentrionalis TaxID=329112 RepID=UPI002479BA63|nr:transforming growth factor-beta-induced protein ig-h3 isoform X2 [Toxorhynchites rutilus septentrionalis]
MKHFPLISLGLLVSIFVSSSICLETPTEFQFAADAQPAFDRQPEPHLERDRESLESDTEILPNTYSNPDNGQPLTPARPFNPANQPVDASSLFQHHFNTFFNAPDAGFFSGGFPGIGFLDLQSIKPWWKGENVCVEREEQEETEDGDDNHEIAVDGGNFQSFGVVNLNIETCAERHNKHVCTSIKNHNGRKRTVKVTRQCCHGYARPRNGPPNAHCEKMDLYRLDETAERLGAKEFVATLKKSGLESILTKDVTLFAVPDSAYTKFAEQMWENNLVAFDPVMRAKRQIDMSGMTARDLILAHTVNGSYHIEDVSNEQLLKTELPNTNIRINIFPRAPSEENMDHPYRYTANCAPLVKLNRVAEKGIVHLTDRVLMPVRNNIMDIIRARDDMTVLRTILEKTGVNKMLEEIGDDKHFTFFAPNDDAFLKLDKDIRRKLKAGNGCAANILKNHILDITFCSLAAVSGVKTSTYNLLSEKLELEYGSVPKSEVDDLSDKKVQHLMINGIATVRESDLLGTNGVIHVIDTVLPTTSGMPISTTLSVRNFTIFKQLIDDAGMEDEFDAMSNKTFFVPSDKAFEQSEIGQYWIRQLKEHPESLKDNLRLKEFLEYHVGEPLIKTSDLQEDMIKTKAGQDLRVNLYTTNPIFSNVINRATVNCARLVHFDDETCGSVVHEIDKVLETPESNLIEALRTNPDYSMFLTLVEKANLTDLLRATNESYTIFVPKNEVFNEVKEWYDELLENTEDLDNVIRSHIVPNVICCAGIVQSDWPFIRTTETINQQRLKLNRNRRPQVQNAGVTKCDIVAKNGIIHEINDVISVQKKQRAEPQGFPSFARPLTFWF